MTHITGPGGHSRLHCAFDWLGKVFVLLAATAGTLFASSHLVGWPSRPDGAKQQRQPQQRQHDCGEERQRDMQAIYKRSQP